MLSNELHLPKILHCPNDKEREPATAWKDLRNQNLSYFINLNGNFSTNQEIASTTIYFGDRLVDNHTPQRHLLQVTAEHTISWKTNIHEQKGCIAFADGHVQQLTSAELQKLIKTGDLSGIKGSNQPALLAIP